MRSLGLLIIGFIGTFSTISFACGTPNNLSYRGSNDHKVLQSLSGKVLSCSFRDASAKGQLVVTRERCPGGNTFVTLVGLGPDDADIQIPVVLLSVSRGLERFVVLTTIGPTGLSHEINCKVDGTSR